MKSRLERTGFLFLGKFAQASYSLLFLKALTASMALAISSGGQLWD